MLNTLTQSFNLFAVKFVRRSQELILSLLELKDHSVFFQNLILQSGELVFEPLVADSQKGKFFIFLLDLCLQVVVFEVTRVHVGDGSLRMFNSRLEFG